MHRRNISICELPAPAQPLHQFLDCRYKSTSQCIALFLHLKNLSRLFKFNEKKMQYNSVRPSNGIQLQFRLAPTDCIFWQTRYMRGEEGRNNTTIRKNQTKQPYERLLPSKYQTIRGQNENVAADIDSRRDVTYARSCTMVPCLQKSRKMRQISAFKIFLNPHFFLSMKIACYHATH